MLESFKPQSITTNRYVIHKNSRTEKLLEQKRLNKCNLSFKGIRGLEEWTYKNLKQKGYVETRMGNFYLPGHEQIYSKLAYTQGNQLLGLGVGAYSYIKDYIIESPGNTRLYENLIGLNDFLAISKISAKANRRTLMERFIILSLMSGKINRYSFVEKFHNDVWNEFNDIFDKLVQHDLIKYNDKEIYITERGKGWKRNIMNEFYSIKKVFKDL